MFNFIRKQFIDVIQWENPPEDMLMWRFPAEDQEIQNGASLTVRESQMAMFVDEGKTADIFAAGRYTLNTQTLPVLTNLKNWDKLFQSPFKSDVYFFNLRQQLGRRWGTTQPITVRDSEFGMVQLRAFGMLAYRIGDPAVFFKEVAGVSESYSSDKLEAQLRNMAVTALASAFGAQGSSFLDMAANQMRLSQSIQEQLHSGFAALGLVLENFTVESITVPDAVQTALDKRISMGMLGDMQRYTAYQTAESIPIAAANEGGMASMGASLSAGLNIGQMMAQSMMNNPVQNQTANAVEDPQVKLLKLKTLLDNGLISAEDYNAAKAEVIKQLIN